MLRVVLGRSLELIETCGAQEERCKADSTQNFLEITTRDLAKIQEAPVDKGTMKEIKAENPKIPSCSVNGAQQRERNGSRFYLNLLR
jgi:hypothetical protein